MLGLSNMDVLDAVFVFVVPSVLVILAVAGFIYSRRGDRTTSISRQVEIFKERMANFDRWQTAAKEVARVYQGVKEGDALAPLIARPEWVPKRPVLIGEVRSRLVTAPESDAAPKQMMHLLPSRTNGRRYHHFSHAIQELKLRPPEMFRDLPCYSLEGASWEDGAPTLDFSLSRYFEFIDTSEALAFEFAVASGHKKQVNKRLLKYRMSLGDPTILGARRNVSSINTLTVRVDSVTKAPTFFLMRRSDKVASESGLYGVIPSGMFQPASAAPTDIKEDLDLWRTIMREYNEEFLGAPDAVGIGGTSIDYDEDEPYRTFRLGLESGKMRGYYLGMGLDPLSLSAKILTAVVFDGDFFDETFAGIVTENDEGVLVSKKEHGRLVGLPLTEETVDDFRDNIKMGAGAEACVRATLRHLDEILK